MTYRDMMEKPITPRNEFLMKQCFAKGFEMGLVSNETYVKSQLTDYVQKYRDRVRRLYPENEIKIIVESKINLV